MSSINRINPEVSVAAQPAEVSPESQAASPQALKPGHVFEARVVSRPAADDPSKQEKGVLLAGRFFPVEVPDDVQSGERIIVQAAGSGSSVSLHFMGRAANPQAPGALELKLRGVLENLKLTESGIAQMKQLFSSPAAGELPLFFSQGAGRFRELEDMLPAGSVISAKELADPASLGKRLAGPPQADLKMMLEGAKKIIEAEVRGSESREFSENVKKLELRLTALLRELSGDRSERAETHEGSRAAERGISPVKTGNPESQQRAEAGRESAFTKLSGILAAISEQGSAGTIDRQDKLRDLITGQIEILKTIETDVKKLLAGGGPEGSLNALLSTLKAVDLESLPGSNDLQRNFKIFISDLRDSLSRLIDTGSESRDIKNLLTEALRTIYSEFRFPAPSDRTAEIPEFPPGLSGKHINILRTLESQIRMVLEAPEGAMFELFQPDSIILEPRLVLRSEKLSEFLKFAPPVYFAGVSDGEEGSQAEESVRFFSDLQKSIRLAMSGLKDPLAAEKEVRSILEKGLDFIRAKTDTGAPPANASLIPGMPAPAESALRGAQEGAHEVAQMIKDILAAGNYAGTAGTAPVLKSGHFSALVELLKGIDKTLSSTAPAAEREFTVFAGDLLIQLEKDIEKPAAVLNETLRKALDTVHGRFMPKDALREDMPLLKLDQGVLRSIENMVNTQEILQRMNPVMQAMGEPVMMLFPCIMQGLLAKLEVTFRPPRVDQNEEDKQNRSGRGDPFERVHITLPCPALGDVTVELAHRKGEVMLSMNLGSAGAADFVRSRIGSLEKVLKNSGYEKTELGVTNDIQAGSERPEWINAILNPSLKVV